MKFLFVLTSLLFGLSALAQTVSFDFKDQAGRNFVKFTSEAVLENIIGTNNQLVGTITTDLKNMQKTSGNFAVPIKGFKTGIAKRDDHLLGWFDAAKFPDAKLTITQISQISQTLVVDSQPITFKALGNFEIKGTKKDVEIMGSAIYMKENSTTKNYAPGDLLRITARFKINRRDFKVEPESAMIAKVSSKVAETIDVEVSAVGIAKK